MKIIIFASMSAAEKVMEIKAKLEKLGHEVVTPRNVEKYADKSLLAENAHESTRNKIHGDLIRKYYEKIKDADVCLTVNERKNEVENYIGGNSLIEMAFAHVLNKPNFILNGVPDVSYRDEIIAMQPVVLNGNLDELLSRDKE